MCGQWSEEGYMRLRQEDLKQEMGLADWKRLVDELADHNIPSLLLRGGEPFLYHGILELLEYIRSKGIFTAIDTNGTMLKQYAEAISQIGNIHLTISVDGPEEIHDRVRGIQGTFQRIRDGVARLNELEQKGGHKISKSVNFTICANSYQSLGRMPDVTRDLGLPVVCIVPYYYVPEAVGVEYERILKDELGCSAYSWRGFHHETSGVDVELFLQELRKYKAGVQDLLDYPYMPLTELEYSTWFSNPVAPVKTLHCTNVEKLIDIQPDGEANFCVDFPDYHFGNVRKATIAEAWNSEQAERFRKYRREKPLPVCFRCGAKYMSEQG